MGRSYSFSRENENEYENEQEYVRDHRPCAYIRGYWR